MGGKEKVIIPVVFSLAPYNDKIMYSWMFFKSIALASKYHWPVYTQSQYITDHEAMQRYGYWPSTPLLESTYDYSYKPEDEKKCMLEVFPDQIIEKYISQFPSETDAFLASLNQSWDEMSQWVIHSIRDNESNRQEKAEAFLCIHAPKFVHDAAMELGIKVIDIEWGPFRKPVYRRTAQINLSGSVWKADLAESFERFQKRTENIPILSSKEILSVFLNDTHLQIIQKKEEEPEYDAGIICGYSVPFVYSNECKITNAELVTKAHEVFGKDHIAVRLHPTDPLRAHFPKENVLENDLVSFIRKSRRIVAASSNVTYEAMLYGRPTYDLGKTPYRKYTNTSLKGLEDRIAPEEFLSYVAFAYLVPWELLNNISYLRWRIQEPRETDIYLYHLKYYLNCYGLPEAVLEQKGTERLNTILQSRGQKVDLREALDQPVWMQTDEEVRLQILKARYLQEYEKLENKLEIQYARGEELASQLTEITDSIRELNKQNSENKRNIEQRDKEINAERLAFIKQLQSQQELIEEMRSSKWYQLGIRVGRVRNRLFYRKKMKK